MTEKRRRRGLFQSQDKTRILPNFYEFWRPSSFKNNLSFLLSNCPCHVFKMLVFLNFPIILLCCIVVFGLSLNRVRNGFVVVRNDVEVKRLVSIGY